MLRTTTHPTENEERGPGVRRLPCLTVVHHGNDQILGQWTSLERGTELVLGRESTCLGAGALDDRAISRMHASLLVGTDGTAVLRDCKSRNGTFMNGSRVAETTLHPGDVIGLGPILLLFHDAPASFRHPRSELLVGVGHGIGDVVAQIEKVAPHPTTVLVLGETGTGKELVAREIHEKSGRKGPFLATNCGGVSDSLLQSELFGCVRGAYSGAERDRAGLFEAANGGTLLLDEIGDASEALQRSFLRVLQDGKVQRLGSTSAIQVNVRIVAATHRDLPSMIALGQFREDLYARLTGWVIQVPPLHDRREDIPHIVRAILRESGHANRGIRRSFMLRLLRYDYPRNVRELRKIIERALIEAGDGPLALSPGIEAMLAPSPEPSNPPAARQQRPHTADELREMLAKHDGNVTHLAKELGIGRNTLYRWLKSAGIEVERLRGK